MQTCRCQTEVNGCQPLHLLPAKAACALLLGALFLPASGFAQSEVAAVSSISVEPPISHAMTAAVSPVVGSGFYQLGAVFDMGAPQSANVPPPPLDAAQEQGQPSLDKSASFLGTSTDAIGSIVLLTAQDILTLDQAGLLGDIEQRRLLTSYLPQDDISASEELSLLLSDIARISSPCAASLPAAVQKDDTKTRQLLRFKVNGQDALENISAFYLSPAQQERAFLLSLDLAVDEATPDGSEGASGTFDLTLHLLFKSSGEFLHYQVAAQVVHTSETDEREEALPISQLATLDNMEAFRTGSLVSLKSTSGEATLDLLLDLGEMSN